MKRFLLTFVFLSFLSTLSAQQVPRQQVVLEIGTGVWCQFCPGASMGAQDLLDNGHRVAVIKYHTGDIYANSFSAARISYYGISSFPTAKFDGILTVAGGSQTNSLYSTYLPRYNQRMAAPSSFTVAIYGQPTGGLNYNTQILVRKVASYTGTNLRLHLVVTETNIPHVWFNQTHVKDVCRLMAPNQLGTALSFTENDFQVVNLNFTLNSAWVVNNLWLVAFVQDNGTKEILQADKVKLTALGQAPLIPLFSANKTQLCENENVTFTDHSLGNPTSWQWTLPGTNQVTYNQQHPVATYTEGGIHNVTLTITSGGNNTSLIEPNLIEVTLLPDIPATPAGDTLIDIYYTLNSEYTVHGSAGAESYEWLLTPADAGTVSGTDTLGLVSWNPTFTGTAQITVASVSDCGESEFATPLEITVTNTVGTGILSEPGFSISPNPSNGRFTLTIPQVRFSEPLNLAVYDVNGRLVWQSIKLQGGVRHINLTHLKAGHYFMIVTGKSSRFAKMFTIQ